ncbi:flavodoxin family protein [Streptomyces capuensis]|uniref:flavodoxin family protein n=1 Tax=Streptomyces capuensis TaxID=1464056 RepID=UPI00099B922C
MLAGRRVKVAQPVRPASHQDAVDGGRHHRSGRQGPRTSRHQCRYPTRVHPARHLAQLLDAADAIVFGSPTYMGTASGAFHVFAEATSKRYTTRAWQDKLAAGFTNSGSKSGDKLHTLQFFTVLAAQHGMHWVSLGLLPGWHSTTASENDLNRLGFYLGAGAQTDTDRGPDGVHKADIATADHLGRRVAAQAAVYAAGRAAVAA